MEKKEERKQEKALMKKAYEKPRIVHQQSLEVMATVCDTLPSHKGASPCTTLLT